jgi:diguanylate cyclase (GGDEF)-like protein/PAS domain S-box-containing protein
MLGKGLRVDFDIAYYKQLLDHLGEGVYFTDRERRILYWNHAAEVMTGYQADEVLGLFCHDHLLQHVNENDQPLCDDDCPVKSAIINEKTVSTRAFLSHKEGDRLPVDIKVSPVYSEDGVLVGAVEVFSDASDQVELEALNQNLRKLIRIDPLTRLPNRRALLDAVHKEYLRFARYGTLFSVIFIEIENFNQIIASCGQKSGGEVLQWFARKLLGGFRKADMPSRWSGEKFIVLLPNAGAKAAEKAAEKVRQQLDGQLCPETGSYINSSFGVAEIGRQDSIERLLQRAERALEQSKEKGKGKVVRL